MRLALRTKSVTTKVTDDEYTRLEGLATANGQCLSEWVRGVLLQPAQSPDQTLLAEVLALRSILLNLLFAVAKGEPVAPEQMKLLIERADAEKAGRARSLLVQS